MFKEGVGGYAKPLTQPIGGSLTVYTIRRLLLIIPSFLVITLIVFMSVRFIPGSIVDTIEAGLAGVGGIDREKVEHTLGLDAPVHIQYGRWLGGVFRGDLGTSLQKGTPVTQEVIQRLPVSVELGVFGILIGLIISIPIGVYSAVRQDTVGDYIGRSFAIFCMAVPGFWLGTLVMVYPSIWWGWTPALEYIPFTEDPGGNLLQFLIPAVVLGMALSGVTMRMTRTMMLEVLKQDYIRTAWAKGLRERIVVMRHALKNALIPIVTIVGLFVPVIIGGTVIIEQIFVLPGVGRLVLESIQMRDYSLVSGAMFFIAIFILVVNLLVDLTYTYLDPRVHYQ